MFVKTKSCFIALLLCITSYFAYSALFLRKADRAAYSKLLSSSASEMPATRQLKQNVTKQIYLTQNNQRQHTRLSCLESVVNATPRGKTYDVIENMHHLDCVIQEIDGTFRKMHSNQGSYDYNAHQFTSHQVHLEYLDGQTKVMDGIAQTLTLIFEKEGLNFHADQLKGRYVSSP